MGDEVAWSWFTYNNLVEVDAQGTLKVGGISSGGGTVDGAFAHVFDTLGTYHFKSQQLGGMTCEVEVLPQASAKLQMQERRVRGSGTSGLGTRWRTRACSCRHTKSHHAHTRTALAARARILAWYNLANRHARVLAQT